MKQTNFMTPEYTCELVTDSRRLAKRKRVWFVVVCEVELGESFSKINRVRKWLLRSGWFHNVTSHWSPLCVIANPITKQWKKFRSVSSSSSPHVASPTDTMTRFVYSMSNTKSQHVSNAKNCLACAYTKFLGVPNSRRGGQTNVCLHTLLLSVFDQRKIHCRERKPKPLAPLQCFVGNTLVSYLCYCLCRTTGLSGTDVIVCC